MSTADMDFLFDDTTSSVTDTDLCDIHERRFLRVRRTLVRTDCVVVQVYDLGIVAPAAFAGADYHQLSQAVLVLPGAGSTNELTVKYNTWRTPKSVDEYLHKPLFSRSSSRTVRMSDNQEYKWSRSTTPGSEWTCTTALGYLVAHYDLKPSGEPQYNGSSGNTLTICHSFIHLTIEIVTSLILMRLISQT